jgi:antitoxin ParD1/3/4
VGAIERLTITLPADMAGMVKGAVDEGGYASTSEVIREALRDWKLKRELRLNQLAELRADISRGLADVAEGRLGNFDAERIIARGRSLLADRSNSASPNRRKRT